MACTTLLVGKKASYNGSTLMARNEDSGSGHFSEKKFVFVKPEDQPRKYVSVISKVEIDLPDDPMRYTAMPNALPDEGIWGAAGFNEMNVAMTGTETLTTNSRVLGADPLVKGGIGEEDLVTITLPYIRSARDGVKRLGALHEQYGTYEMNGIGFQDNNEIWWFETIGGHHWIAKRVPDETYVVMPNQLGIDSFDFTDAYGAQENCMCSEDLAEFVENNMLDPEMDTDVPVRERFDFDIRGAFGSHSDSDHVYNNPRAWYMLRYFNPRTLKWEGNDADFLPENDDLPWCMVPERKITIEDMKYILSSYYQGTDYNPYSKHADPLKKGMYRPIGINRNNFLSITELRPDVPAEVSAVEWICFASNAFNCLVPFYANVNDTPDYMKNVEKDATTDSMYWVSRTIAALADPHYAACIPHIERMQLKLTGAGHAFLRETDKNCPKAGLDEIRAYLTDANEKMAKTAKEAYQDTLNKVLFEASMDMKNAYSRSDA